MTIPSLVGVRPGSIPGEWVLRFFTAKNPSVVVLPPAMGVARFEIEGDWQGRGPTLLRRQFLQGAQADEPLAHFKSLPDAQASLDALMTAWVACVDHQCVDHQGVSARPVLSPSTFSTLSKRLLGLMGKSPALAGAVAVAASGIIIFGLALLVGFRLERPATHSGSARADLSQADRAPLSPSVWTPKAPPAPAPFVVSAAPIKPFPEHEGPFKGQTYYPGQEQAPASLADAVRRGTAANAQANPMIVPMTPAEQAVISSLGTASPTAQSPAREAQLQELAGRSGAIGDWAISPVQPIPGKVTATPANPGDVFIQTVTAPTIENAELAKMLPRDKSPGIPEASYTRTVAPTGPAQAPYATAPRPADASPIGQSSPADAFMQAAGH